MEDHQNKKCKFGDEDCENVLEFPDHSSLDDSVNDKEIVHLKLQLDESHKIIQQLQCANWNLEQKVELLLEQKRQLIKVGEQRDRVNLQLKKQNQQLNYVRLKLKTRADEKKCEERSRCPLLHDVVINKIFTYIEDGEDLLNARLVCRKWNHYAVCRIRNKFVKSFVGPGVQQLPPFVDTMEGTKDFPITQFRVGGFPIRNFQPLFEKFFIICGPFVRGLNLNFAAINSKVLKEFVFPMAPNLECLNVIIPTEYQPISAPPAVAVAAAAVQQQEQPAKNVVPLLSSLRRLDIIEIQGSRIEKNQREEFCLLLLQQSPNIQILKVRTGYGDTISNVLGCLENLSIKVRELYLDCPMDEQDLQTLKRLKMQLVTLRFGYFCEDVQFETVEELLKASAKTLTNLFIGDCVSAGLKYLFMNFPVMENLKRLELWQAPEILRPRQIFLADLFKTKKFPKLKRLIFRYSNYGSADLRDVFQEPHEKLTVCKTLEDLELPRAYDVVRSIITVARVFPMLQKLKIDEASDAVIRAVYINLKNLDSLSLSFGTSNSSADALITGFPQQICDNLKGNQRMTGYSDDSKSEKDQFFHIVKTNCGISDLQRLTKLELSCREVVPMTDVGIIYGLLYLPNLKYFSIKSWNVSKEGREILQARLNRLEVKPPREEFQRAFLNHH